MAEAAASSHNNPQTGEPSEAELRRRKAQAAVTDSEDDKAMTEEQMEELTKFLPQASDATVNWLDRILSGLPTRWRNWAVRGIFTTFMLLSFAVIIRCGPIALMALVMAIQVKCFSEIIAIGHAVYRVYDLPWFRTLSWYLLIASNYFFFGESLIDYWGTLLRKDGFLQFMVSYHRIISLALYLSGFVWFVLSLRKGYYMRQFSLFAWTHVTLLLIVTQSYLIIQNIFQGIIWLLVPASMIICNDIMSYMFGFFFGKTPLIKLSPKKTWEGFAGGAMSTLVFGVMLAYCLLHYEFYVCPLEYSDDAESFTSDCVIPSTFQLQEFSVPRPLSYVWMLAGRRARILMYPFLAHTVVMGLFAALLGPFGGFFASGFKRAFKIKDFGDIIPGHGGLMDRFDCQLLMGTFVNVFIHTFIRLAEKIWLIPNPERIVQQILMLSDANQYEVYRLLTARLIQDGIVNATSIVGIIGAGVGGAD